MSQAMLCPAAMLQLWSFKYMAHLWEQHMEG